MKNIILGLLDLCLFLCSRLGGCHNRDGYYWSKEEQTSKQPVIIDTDIGSFIDDSFAIVYAAQAPELDIKLIVTSSEDTTARAKVVAKLMKMLGTDTIPIGIGLQNNNQTRHSLLGWGADENLTTYQGGVFEDGIAKMAEIIENSTVIVDIIAIGPMTNFPSLLQRYPDIAKKTRIRAMAGSIHTGYYGSEIQAAEYNVAMCPWCMEVLLTAGWHSAVTIAPLDTCSHVVLDRNQVEEMLEGDSKAAAALASTLAFYCTQEDCNLKEKTPVLFDVVGTLLTMPATAIEYLNYVVLDLKVNSTGYTVIDKSGTPTSTAISWKENGVKKFTDVLTKLYSL